MVPTYLLGEEFLPLLALDHLGEDRLLALGGELDGLVAALHPLLDEAPLLQVVDVHIFEADRCRSSCACSIRQDLRGSRRCFEAERAAEIDRAIEVVGAESRG